MKKGFVKVLGLILGSFMCFSCAQASGGDDGSAGTAGGSSNNGSSTVIRFPYGKYQFVRESGIYPVDFSENSASYEIQLLDNNQVRIKDKEYTSFDYTYGWSTSGTTLYLIGYSVNEDPSSISPDTDLFGIGRASNCLIYYNKDTKVFRLDRVTDSGNGGGNGGGGNGGGGSVTAESIIGTWTYTGSSGNTSIKSTLVFKSDGKVEYSSNDSQKAPSWTASYTVSNSKLKLNGSYKMSGNGKEQSFDNEEHELSISNGKLYISNLSGTMSTSFHFGTNNIENEKLVMEKSN